MKVNVLCFGAMRERLRTTSLALDLADGADLAAALDALCEIHEPVAAAREHLRLAVNGEYAPLDTALQDGDELALIPPVAGG